MSGQLAESVQPRAERRVQRAHPAWVIGPSAAAACALLLWFGTGLHAIAALTWFAPLPLFFVSTWLPRFSAFSWSVVGWLVGCLNLWSYAVNRLHAPVPVVAGLLLVEAVAFGAVVLVLRTMLLKERRVLAVLGAAASATVLDQLLSQISPHGTFTSPAWTQADTPLLPMVALTGGAGIVALLYAVPAVIAVIGVDMTRKRGMSRAATYALLGVVVAGVLLPLAGGLAEGAGGREVRVAMISSPAGRGDGPAKLASPAGRSVLATDLSEVRRAAGRGARIAVLPEAGLWIHRASLASVASEFRETAGPQTTAVLGAVIEDANGALHNEAVLVRPNGPVLEYRKRHLVPGSEPGVTPGSTTLVTDVAGVRTALVICKDLDFPSTIRESSEQGARLVLAPSWDFRVDGRLHSQMALVRAAENGFALVRPVREGRGMIADPHGRIVATSDTVRKPTQVVVANVRVGERRTPYTAMGDWFTLGCVGIVIVGVTALARDRRRKT